MQSRAVNQTIHTDTGTITAAWIIMLLVSLLPNIIGREFFGMESGMPLLVFKLALLALLLIGGLWSALLRALRPYVLVLLVFYSADLLIFTYVGNTGLWRGWFGDQASFDQNMLSVQLRKLAVAVIVIGALLALGFTRSRFLLVRGQLDAPIQPVPLLGYSKPEPWTRFGSMWTIFITGGTLVFLVIAGAPTIPALLAIIPMLPLLLLLAAMNAFSEGVTYRAGLMGTLDGVLPPRQILWLTAVFFGIAHYYGVPYGVVGVLMSTFLGWMLSKAMLETRGFFWAWFIHFWQDVVIFIFLAVGTVTPGGL